MPEASAGVPLLLTVDTEADDLWSRPARPTFANLRELSALQALCDRYGLRPTYLVTYAVTRDEPSAALLQALSAEGNCEIGAHLHAWSTPPLLEIEGAGYNPYLYEYPHDVQEQKLSTLTDLLAEVFGGRPTSYRAGRWGLDGWSLQMLARLGYEVDSTVTPWVSWERARGGGAAASGPSFVGAPLAPYHPCAADPCQAGDLSLWEVPVTIAPLGPRLRAIAPSGLRALYRPQGVAARVLRKALRLAGLVRLSWLRPLYASVAEMLALSRAAVDSGLPVLNLMFHSSELIDSPNGRQGELLAELKEYLAGLADQVAVRGMALTEFARAQGGAGGGEQT